MKAPTSDLRFNNAKTLLDYGFKNYTYKQLASKGDIVANISVSKGIEKNVNAVLNEDAGVLIKKGKEGEVVQNIQLEKNISAPVQEKQKIGTVIYNIEGKTVATVNLVAERSIEKETFAQIAKFVYKKWFTLIRK